MERRRALLEDNLILSSNDLSELKYWVQDYLHQDFDVVHGSADNALIVYKTEESPEKIEKLKHNLAEIIPSNCISSSLGADAQTALLASQLEIENNQLGKNREVQAALGYLLGVGASVGSLGLVVTPEFWQGLKLISDSDHPLALLKLALQSEAEARGQDFNMFIGQDDVFGAGMVVGRTTADTVLIAKAVGSLPTLVTRVVAAGGRLVVGDATVVLQNGKLGVEGAGSVVVPNGFASGQEFTQFGINMRNGLNAAGHADAEPLLQGSAVTGKSFETGQPFDVGRVSDFDVALVSPTLLQAAEDAGIGLRSAGTRTGPLSAADLQSLGLRDLANQMSQQVGRDVNFMIYNSMTAATQRAPSIVLPKLPR